MVRGWARTDVQEEPGQADKKELPLDISHSPKIVSVGWVWGEEEKPSKPVRRLSGLSHGGKLPRKTGSFGRDPICRERAELGPPLDSTG